jgi:hypothetical protein
MNKRAFEIKIDRVIVVGPEIDARRSQRLGVLIEQAMREKITTVQKFRERYEGGPIRINLPGLSLDSVEGERRVAYATAEAVMNTLLGKGS